MRKLLIAFALVAGLVVQAAGASAQTVGDVETRDRLIADQENLLNAYRCLYDTDTDVVPGGCGDPDQIEPGPAPAQPTAQDVEARDRLIAEQENLLNVYRCQFDVDTQLVPGGCPDDNTTPASLGPVPPLAELWAERERLAGLLVDCGWWTGDSFRECQYPSGRLNLVDQIKISRGFSELYGCDTGYLVGTCFGELYGCDSSSALGGCFWGPATNPGADTWRKRIELAEYQEACGYGRGQYWRDFNYWECYNDPLDPSAPARPEHNAEVIRLGSEAYDCEFQVLRNNHGFCISRGQAGGVTMRRVLDNVFCQDGWIFRSYAFDDQLPYSCYHPNHPTNGIHRPR